MLASLLRGNSGQKGGQYPESVTDDAHTRNLLFGQSEHVFNLTTSPPSSPFGSPALRPTSYDDHGGLELEEKDIRVLLAQDAYSGSAGPTLLFDSRKPVEAVTQTSKDQNVPRSQLPSNWRSQNPTSENNEETFRARSSTFSGTHNSWGKATKDLVKDDPFLDCMFGAPSSTKTASSTKMHIIPSKSRPMNASERLPRRPTENIEPRRRAPLNRAQTSGTQPTLSTLEDSSRDLLLITRLFHITLEDHAKVAGQHGSTSYSGQAQTSSTTTQTRLPDLVELKVPAFAIGFVLQLPYPLQRPPSAHSRNAFNTNTTFSLASATSSYGSDMQSSWTFLDAIPASLSSSITFSDDGDRRVDAIVASWDVILRSISSFERIAAAVVKRQLEHTLAHMNEPPKKISKERFTQQDNKRVIAIHDPASIGRSPSLSSAAIDISRRIVYAIRIPRVVTGLGVSAGHWNDEARMLFRSCGGRQQNFFLFNLLTAFLGNHMQWLERLAPDWYRKQFQANHKKQDEPRVLASRTIIVSEHKSLARRLIYILASFLPGRAGIDGLDKVGEDSAIASSSSPSRNVPKAQFARRSSKPSIRSTQAVTDSPKQLLSTSASSQHSQASTSVNRSPRKSFLRKDSNKFLLTKDAIISKPETESKLPTQEAVGTITAVIPNAAATPIAYIASRRDSYFPESPLVETNDSVASADLAKVLHKASFSHRRTSSVSSRWGSLVSGISEIWSNKQSTPGDRGSVATNSYGGSPAELHKRSASSAVSIGQSTSLQMMVDELDQRQPQSKNNGASLIKHNATSPGRQSVRTFSATPRLQVDDRDGVVDVELDLPGFLSASGLTPPKHQKSRPQAKGASFNRDCSDSICSVRSMAAKSSAAKEDEQVNVGGYLKRHHEDFVLHAVKPYNELIEDIKRAMKAEPTPQEVKDQLSQQGTPAWVPICTTLVADTKPFTIHRMTLRRQFMMRYFPTDEFRNKSISEMANSGVLTLLNEDITDEVVMEFDTTLADAVEKALNLGTADATRSSPSTRTHSRNVSVSSVRGAPPGVSQSRTETQQETEKREPTRSEQRNPVVGALEDVVRSVNNHLNKSGQPRDRDNSQKLTLRPTQQENALREGVKNWMLSVEQNSEQTSVW